MNRAQIRERDLVSDFLYNNPPLGGMPDQTLRIGVQFEVGGTYEDWGWVVERKGKRIAAARTLKAVIEKARQILRQEFEASDKTKCHRCGKNEEAMKHQVGDKLLALCMDCFTRGFGSA